jgi:hypothetical protein
MKILSTTEDRKNIYKLVEQANEAREGIHWAMMTISLTIKPVKSWDGS